MPRRPTGVEIGFGFAARTHTPRHRSEGLRQDQGQHSLGVWFIVLDLPCGQDFIIPPPEEGICYVDCLEMWYTACIHVWLIMSYVLLAMVMFSMDLGDEFNDFIVNELIDSSSEANFYFDAANIVSEVSLNKLIHCGSMVGRRILDHELLSRHYLLYHNYFSANPIFGPELFRQSLVCMINLVMFHPCTTQFPDAENVLVALLLCSWTWQDYDLISLLNLKTECWA
jgi:hypothetical protein